MLNKDHMKEIKMIKSYIEQMSQILNKFEQKDRNNTLKPSSKVGKHICTQTMRESVEFKSKFKKSISPKNRKINNFIILNDTKLSEEKSRKGTLADEDSIKLSDFRSTNKKEKSKMNTTFG